MKDVSIEVEAMGFDFMIVEPNLVNLEQDKMRGIGIGDQVTITSNRESTSYTFKVTKLYFNGFEYEK